jgi:pimeloyl-ACP methyl ester carboxylesterase
MTSEPAPYQDRYYTRDELRLHYRDYPGPIDKPPLLCLPGLTRNARDFAAFAERHSPRYRVLCPDFRGRGMSDHDPVPMRYLPPTYAHDTIALLDHVGVADAIFVGTSLGGIVAMLVAVLDEDRIAASVLNDVGPELAEAGIEHIRNYVGTEPTFATWAEAAEAVKANQRGLPAHWQPADWEMLARRLCSKRQDGSIRFDYDPAIAVPFRNAATGSAVDMWPLFDALARKPVLAVRGAHSELFTAEALEAMGKRSDNVASVTVAGVGHPPELGEPEAVAAIDAFLARLSAR